MRLVVQAAHRARKGRNGRAMEVRSCALVRRRGSGKRLFQHPVGAPRHLQRRGRDANRQPRAGGRTGGLDPTLPPLGRPRRRATPREDGIHGRRRQQPPLRIVRHHLRVVKQPSRRRVTTVAAATTAVAAIVSQRECVRKSAACLDNAVRPEARRRTRVHTALRRQQSRTQGGATKVAKPQRTPTGAAHGVEDERGGHVRLLCCGQCLLGRPPGALSPTAEAATGVRQ